MKNRLVELRRQNRMSQKDLVTALGVSRQTVSSIENGRYNPSLELAFQLSEVFGQPIEDIFIFEEK
jgi:putative transcriptional regulator